MNESFEYQGYWWLPDTPEEQVPGILRFDPDEGATLNLVGSFGGIKGSSGTMEDLFPSPESGLILGFSVNGKAITLSNCNMTRGSFGMPGFPTSTYSSSMIFVGEHFERPEDIGFEGLSVEYAHLEEWVSISGFVLKMPDDPKDHPYVIEHQVPERIPVSVGEISISLMFGVNHEYSNPLVRTASITQKAYITVEFSEKKPMDDLLKIIYRIQNFLSFGVRSPVHPLSVKGITSSSENLDVEIYYRPLGRTDSTKKVHPVDMLFTLHDLPGGLDRALGTWLEKSEDLEPVYQLFLGTLYNPQAYLTQQFLSLVQALEVYHREAVYVPDMPEEEHEKRVEKILDSAPAEHKGWLRQKLRVVSEPSLGERLHKILKKHRGTSDVVVGKKGEARVEFVDKVVDSRNYLAHRDKGKKERAARGVELYQISQKLKRLLEACLMGEIGFEDDEIRKLISGIR